MREEEEGPDRFLLRCKIGFIGAGNMAQGIVTRMLDNEIVTEDSIAVSAPTEKNFAFWKSKAIYTTNLNAEVIRKCEIVILAMKPQHFEEALKGFDTVPADRLYISVLAGMSVKKLNDKFQSHYNYTNKGPRPWRIVRLMPNPPVAIGAGITVCATSPLTTPNDIQTAKAIFSAGGLFETVPENLMDVVSALSGCSTVYIYLVIEALCDGAVKMGLPRALAMKLACRTVIGSGKMVEETGKHPGLLKDEGCSPKGTTITGIHVLERSGTRAALIEAIETATLRSIEIGNEM